MTIGDNPVSRNLARFLGYYEHLKAGSNQASRGFRLKLKRIHEKIKAKYPGKNQDQCTPESIITWMRGRPCKFDSLRKIAEVIDINPYDFYVDIERWFNIENLTATHKDIFKLLQQITKIDNLDTIKNVVNITLKDELKTNLIDAQNHNYINNH